MKNLLEPLEFRNGLVAPNRVTLAPMTNGQSHDDGTLSEDELRWLRMRAEGGFGVVTTCASHVTRDGQGWRGELGCFSDDHIPGLRRIASTVHEHRALAFVQIFHGGLRADRQVMGERPWSASELSPEGARAGTTDDIQRVIAAFADAAHRAHQAGMDGVEIHGAHGYLLTQFLSRIENQRTDAWGGSLDHRCRLMREVVRAVRARVPDTFAVGIRISPEDFGNAKGLDLDENLQLARWLCEDGLDFLHLSLWEALRNSSKRPTDHPVSAFRAVVPRDITILVAGKIWTRAEGEQLLKLGADGIALARSAIANPDWPRRIADPAWEPRHPPLTVAELKERGLADRFVSYMRLRKDFVAD